MRWIERRRRQQGFADSTAMMRDAESGGHGRWRIDGQTCRYSSGTVYCHGRSLVTLKLVEVMRNVLTHGVRADGAIIAARKVRTKENDWRTKWQLIV